MNEAIKEILVALAGSGVTALFTFRSSLMKSNSDLEETYASHMPELWAQNEKLSNKIDTQSKVIERQSKIIDQLTEQMSELKKENAKLANQVRELTNQLRGFQRREASK